MQKMTNRQSSEYPKFIKSFTVEGHKRNWELLQPAVKLYEEIGKRTSYLFDWLLYMTENVYFSCTDPKHLQSLCITRTKVMILDTLLDDIADIPNEKVDFFLNELLKFPFERETIQWERLNEEEKKYIENTLALWDDITETARSYPRFTEFERIFEFDIRQLINSMRFAHLANTFPEFDNIVENRVYGHHSMTVIICGMLELMCSPTFDIRELHQVRKLLFYSQQLARIGNMVSTYSREINERDISSEILTIAVEQGVINPEQMDEISGEQMKAIEILKKSFDLYWDGLYSKIENVAKNIKSIDMKTFLEEREFVQKMYKERVNYWKSAYKDRVFVV